MFIANAKISSTMLGIEDHGIMSFSLMMDMGGTGQGFGGYTLDGKSGTIGHPKSILAVRRIIEVVGVEKWEDVKGKFCRIRKENEWNSPITAIGNIIKDDWFNLEEFFKDVK